MKRRVKVRKGPSQALFRKTSGVKPVNVHVDAMRGGIRM